MGVLGTRIGGLEASTRLEPRKTPVDPVRRLAEPSVPLQIPAHARRSPGEYP